MLPIDFTTSASVTWQHPPYGKTAAEEHCDEFNLAEAVRFVMEQLAPDHKKEAKIIAGGQHYRLDEIGGLYRRADFPRG